LQVFARNGLGVFEQPVCQRTFAVVDMGYYAKIANIIHTSNSGAKLRIFFEITKNLF